MKAHSSPKSLSIPFLDISRDILSSNKWLRAFFVRLLAMFLAKDALWVISLLMACGYHRSCRQGRLLNKLLCAISSRSPPPVIKRPSQNLQTTDAASVNLILGRSFWKCMFHLVHFASPVIFPAQNNVWQYGDLPQTFISPLPRGKGKERCGIMAKFYINVYKCI